LIEWELEEKVFAITVDNCHNISKAIEILKTDNKSLIHIGCFAHTLNLIVRKFINNRQKKNFKKDIETEDDDDDWETAASKTAKTTNKFTPNDDEINLLGVIKTLLGKCRSIATRFNHSTQLNNELLAKQNNGEVYQLINDFVIRWNSTFKMLERILKLKKAINSTLNDDESVESKKLVLKEKELEILSQLEDVLYYFNNATEILSSQSKCNISQVLPIINSLKTMMKPEEDDSAFTICAKKLLERSINFYDTKYSYSSNPFLIAASYLDPRNRMFLRFENKAKKMIKTAKDYV
jgi:hypothetical protein